MLLHVSYDDKFVDMSIRQFSEVSSIPQLLVVISGSAQLKYVKSPADVISVNQLNNYIRKSMGKHEITAVIFHSLRPYKLKLPSSLVKVWIGMGFDYYDYINIPLYSNRTKKLLRDKVSGSKIKSFILNRRKKRLAKDMDIFCPVIQEEYELLKDKVDINKTIDWNYGYLSDWIGSDNIDNPINIGDENLLLVGNSADPSNNHIDVIEDVANSLYKDQQLIVPVSYGSQEYLCRLEKEISNYHIVNRVKLIKTFMSIDRYTEMLMDCKYAIMNHYRQQALGNIITLLYFGKTVYLRSDNPLYAYLRRLGVIIKDVEDVANKGFASISLDNAISNRAIISRLYSKDYVDNKSRNLLNEIKKISATKR
ncbi:TDP-N-acetylfucosamine:lipid II N-acetylfucosaminyltransferase [Vibrio sp. Vb2131]|uniref:TDP-N-acetylfucosamine:lipid II N-acetylfucosaminyltransferase n=1 Tax=Vibrio sp. Vb2131 TaxID=3074649 RepID=UPI002964B0D5|nr:TDP-N-acetylfucosamine:lipid II N-acetylfucosaminyltransferase [Vibrio sp. Vb2131]MDW1886843.1 TDP-N-acetylfucosamine:lipid II N-acetylfucosaminyltransferase [Vibrio sp. Vb2131]